MRIGDMVQHKVFSDMKGKIVNMCRNAPWPYAVKWNNEVKAEQFMGTYYKYPNPDLIKRLPL